MSSFLESSTLTPADAPLPSLSEGLLSLNVQLSSLGLDTVSLDDEPSDDVLSALHALHQLLSLHGSLSALALSREADAARLTVELDALSSSRDLLSDKVDALKGTLAQARDRHRELDESFRAARADWARERGELSVQCTKLRQRDAHYAHRLRKAEQEAEKAQERLARLVAERGSAAVTPAHFAVRAVRTERGAEKDGRALRRAREADLCRCMAQRYEAKQRALAAEAALLRDALESATLEMKNVLAEAPGGEEVAEWGFERVATEVRARLNRAGGAHEVLALQANVAEQEKLIRALLEKKNDKTDTQEKNVSEVTASEKSDSEGDEDADEDDDGEEEDSVLELEREKLRCEREALERERKALEAERARLVRVARDGGVQTPGHRALAAMHNRARMSPSPFKRPAAPREREEGVSCLQMSPIMKRKAPVAQGGSGDENVLE